ncbi:GNAT family N-acetyltransferase [Chitinivorax sp. B]|uniref:GNAT family N-acetyltransferase n=1 Tax=Chitinivorax sp. B TaxID=2502235 RepID=UPI0010F95296|nr:GNAT family N-acetyltransferase [Chitinivorax sp. B]
MHFRPATAHDIQAIATLHAQSWQQAYRGILCDRYLDEQVITERSAIWHDRLTLPTSDQSVLVAEHEDLLAGFVCTYLHTEPGWSYLDNLHVDHRFKGQGIGTQLVARAADWCYRHRPQDGLFLWALAANMPARRFYEQLGAQHSADGIWAAPDGIQIPEHRYEWQDLGPLTARLKEPLT